MFSQAVLGLQSPFARVPLLMFTTRAQHLGGLAFGPGTSAAPRAAAGILLSLNGWMLRPLLAGSSMLTS